MNWNKLFKTSKGTKLLGYLRVDLFLSCLVTSHCLPPKFPGFDSRGFEKRRFVKSIYSDARFDVFTTINVETAYSSETMSQPRRPRMNSIYSFCSLLRSELKTLPKVADIFRTESNVILAANDANYFSLYREMLRPISPKCRVSPFSALRFSCVPESWDI
jgi:hypothetical protein